MFHVPTNETWDPEALAERLREQNLEAIVLADSVRITLPTIPPATMLERLQDLIFPARSQHLTLRFNKQKFICNIELVFDPLNFSHESVILTQISKACKQRGYWCKPGREIAMKYCPDSAELKELLEKVEQLQIEKENLVANQNVEQAAKVRDDETLLKQRIDAILFKAMCEPDNSVDDPVKS